jgi:hypothetical protein
LAAPVFARSQNAPSNSLVRFSVGRSYPAERRDLVVIVFSLAIVGAWWWIPF